MRRSLTISHTLLIIVPLHTSAALHTVHTLMPSSTLPCSTRPLAMPSLTITDKPLSYVS